MLSKLGSVLLRFEEKFRTHFLFNACVVSTAGIGIANIHNRITDPDW